ncbi:hypothetical protein EYF80_035882 [Liparis tanakae]|uniref:Uncharacterized protein n=1 Tax=Liparis tanakae TaxID=230148 RepID=A0A4Z2GKX7_9TELE|nr:hypothetical protein EYF80_035882 [Liparis tanakae]
MKKKQHHAVNFGSRARSCGLVLGLGATGGGVLPGGPASFAGKPASSTSPPAAEWKLRPELLKPLTLSPDDSELSTGEERGRGHAYPPRPPPPAPLHLGPRTYPTREPLPEEDELHPDPTDRGRPPGSPSRGSPEPVEDSARFSAPPGEKDANETKKTKMSRRLPMKSCRRPLTSPQHREADGAVADGRGAGLDVRERLVSDAHELSLLHTDLWEKHV